MGDFIDLTAADGHRFAAYEAKPAGKPRGGLVIVQEIFGVNRHIRSVADGYAADGYHCIAPALFDRAERDVEMGYDADTIKRGLELRAQVGLDGMLADVQASADYLKASGKVGIVGYCLGGSLAFIAATRLTGFSGNVGYYGGMIAPIAEERPKCPVLLHFGETDHSIPLADVETIRAKADPALVEVNVYPAGHGFNCDDRAAYEPVSAKLARERSIAFLRTHIG